MQRKPTPLTNIRVWREDYCSQEIADRAIFYLREHNWELMREFLMEEGGRQHDYAERAWDILEFWEQNNIEIPKTRLGRMDLIHELSRRLRGCYGMTPLDPRGHSLAAGPGQPLPPLVSLPLSAHTRQWNHVTQEIVDRVLSLAYERRPDLWFEAAEEYRFLIIMDSAAELYSLLKEICLAEFPSVDFWGHLDLRHEAVRRMYIMCGIPEPAEVSTGEAPPPSPKPE